MPEDVEKHFAFLNFINPVPGTPMEVIDNEITPRDKISLNGIGTTKGTSGGASMMLKQGWKWLKIILFSTTDPPIPHKHLK